MAVMTDDEWAALGQKCGEWLLGSCERTVDQFTEEHGVVGIPPTAFFQAVDNTALECSQCGWWLGPEEFTLSECPDENVCDECYGYGDF